MVDLNPHLCASSPAHFSPPPVSPFLQPQEHSREGSREAQGEGSAADSPEGERAANLTPRSTGFLRPLLSQLLPPPSSPKRLHWGEELRDEGCVTQRVASAPPAAPSPTELRSREHPTIPAPASEHGAQQRHAEQQQASRPPFAQIHSSKPGSSSSSGNARSGNNFTQMRISGGGASEAPSLMEIGQDVGLDPPLDSYGIQPWVGLRHRTKNLCRMFGLPNVKEDLLSEFHGAVRKRVLMQGRVYVFANYLCFTSNPFFGYIKKIVIPFHRVKSIRKKTHCRVPNSIEIETIGGNKEFITNLLNRQEAYDIICKCWARVRPVESQAGQYLNKDQRLCSSNSVDLSDSTFAGGKTMTSGENTLSSAAGQSLSVPQDLDMLDKQGSQSPNRRARMAQQMQQRAAGADNFRTPLARNKLSSTSLGDWSQTSTLHERATLHSEGNSMDDEEDDNDDSGNAVYSLVESRPPPPKAPDSRVVLSTVLPGTPEKLYDVLLATKSHFMEDFLESEGNRRINLTPWKRHHQLAHVRDLSFVAPIRGAFGNWGVSHTQCFQSHRFCRHTGDHLVFESSQTMTDIPYGDCFTVDIRWDITPTTIQADQEGQTGAPGLKIDIVMRVPFQRSCLFKKVIESGTQKQVLQTYTAMVEALKPALLEASQNQDLPLHVELDSKVRESGSLQSPAPPTPLPNMYRASSQKPGQDFGMLERKNSKLAEQPSTITVSDGKTHVALPTTSSLISPTVLDFLNAETSVKARHMGCLSSSFLKSIGQNMRSAAFSINEFLLGLVGCSMNPQLLWLTIIVLCTFVAQLFFISASWRAGGKPAAMNSMASGGFPSMSGQIPFNLGPPGAPTPPPSSGAAFSGSSAGPSASSTASMSLAQQFWVQRLEMLQLEMGMLQRRMQLVAEEINFTSTQQQYHQEQASQQQAAQANSASAQDML